MVRCRGIECIRSGFTSVDSTFTGKITAMQTGVWSMKVILSRFYRALALIALSLCLLPAAQAQNAARGSLFWAQNSAVCYAQPGNCSLISLALLETAIDAH